MYYLRMITPTKDRTTSHDHGLHLDNYILSQGFNPSIFDSFNEETMSFLSHYDKSRDIELILSSSEDY